MEDKKENLQKYEQEIDENTALEEVRKKRLKCLFLQSDPNREQELEENLVSNYRLTKSRMDLLNLITFYKAKQNWGKMSEYADKLVDVHKDSYGMLYQIQALLELQENQKALEIADELEDKKIWGTELEVSWDKMYIYQQMGEYDKAIAAGERVLACKATEDIILKLSNLCALNGEEGKALQILLSSELRGVLTVPICQRISVYYLNNDNIVKQANNSTEKQANDSTVQQSIDSTVQQSIDSIEKQANDSTDKQANDNIDKQVNDSTDKQAKNSTKQQDSNSFNQARLKKEVNRRFSIPGLTSYQPTYIVEE